ncbi:hypothetical protein F4808DRAFT_453972 [Astrocystis sublimbata]|nr:hypothetical protein F4808DRAFT_453972 [Astrocystis sublimbata]
MASRVLRLKKDSNGVSEALEAIKAHEAGNANAAPAPIPSPPEDATTVKATCDTITLTSFTTSTAWTLGHLLYARLLPFAHSSSSEGGARPTLISIALAHGEHVVFQAAVGSGTAPDNEIWVRRKRASVLRFGTSTWYLHCKYKGDEEAFRKKFAMGEDKAGGFAIHGGGVPIRVAGVEGIVAVVVVSGLKQHEDHGVIVDVINSHFEPVS